MAKTYDTYKDSGIAWIGEIPSEWEVCQFKRVHTGTNVGESIDKEFWSDNPNDRVFYTAGLNPIYTCFPNFPISKYTNINDILLSRNGTPYVYLPTKNAAYTDHIIRVSIKKQYNRIFLKYALSQSISYEIVDSVSIATWSASLWNLQLLPLPSLSDQHSIATFLDTKCGEIDALISLQEEMISELQAYKQSVITEAVTKGLNPNAKMKDSGVEWIGEIPEEWAIVKFKYICDKIGDGLHGTPIYDDYGDFYFINGNNLGQHFITIKEETNKVGYNEYCKYKTDLNDNTILISLNGTIGNCSFYHNEPIILSKSAGYINVNKNVSKEYIHYLLNSNGSKIIFELSLAGTTIANLSLATLRNLPAILPPLPEQHSIATYLDEKTSQIDSLISLKQEKIEELKDYKKSIIYEYVTGKKRV